MDIFFRQIMSYLPCPSSISPPPGPFAPRPHSEHVRWFWGVWLSHYTAHSSPIYLCNGAVTSVAVFTTFAVIEETAPEIGLVSLTMSTPSPPPSSPALLSEAVMGSWVWALVSLLPSQASHSPDRRLTRSQRPRAACKTVTLENSAKYWSHSPPPPLLTVLFWQVKTNVIFFPAVQLNLHVDHFVSRPSLKILHLIWVFQQELNAFPPSVICLFKGKLGGRLTFNAELLLSIMNYECAVNNERSSWA